MHQSVEYEDQNYSIHSRLTVKGEFLIFQRLFSFVGFSDGVP